MIKTSDLGLTNKQKQGQKTISRFSVLSRTLIHEASRLPSTKIWHQGTSLSQEHFRWLLTNQHQESSDHLSLTGGALFYPKKTTSFSKHRRQIIIDHIIIIKKNIFNK